MASLPTLGHLPGEISVADFDALHDDPAAWRAVVASIAAEHGSAGVEPIEEGTVLVARIDGQRILKVYPPFLRDHFEFECAMLAALQGRLALPTPQLLATGTRDGWPYLLMSRLVGEPLTASWPRMDEDHRLALLDALGALAAQVHALPVGDVVQRAPDWAVFVQGQRERCGGRQQRTGLPPHLLAQLPDFIAGALPEGPPVLLTGEYTPFSLFTVDNRLAAMFDFGDGLVGPREYDWLGPLCFLAAGDARRCARFMHGYGAALDPGSRLRLLRMLLLHRYSNLPAQIAHPGWQQAATFEDLAASIWPL
jgi:hygromycin-B 7''-O-kinase